MANRKDDRRLRRAQKLRLKRITSLIAPPQTHIDLQADQAEINLFLAIARFQRLVSDIKRSLYRKPQHVWKQS